MLNRLELENELINEIHTLSIEAIETILKLTLLLKKTKVIETMQQSDNFIDFIRNSPLMDIEIDLTRNSSSCRELDL